MYVMIIENPEAGRLRITHLDNGEFKVKAQQGGPEDEPYPVCEFGKQRAVAEACALAADLLPIIEYFSRIKSTGKGSVTFIEKGKKFVLCWPITHIAYAVTIRMMLQSRCCYFQKYEGFVNFLPIDLDVHKIFHFLFSSSVISSVFVRERCNLTDVKSNILRITKDIKKILKHMLKHARSHYNKDAMLNALNIIFSVNSILDMEYASIENELRTSVLVRGAPPARPGREFRQPEGNSRLA